MSTILFSNGGQSTLAGAITNTALVAELAPGGGALFPAPGAGEYFVMTFIDQATGLVNEIVHVTDVTGDTITMIRGQEDTTPVAWSAGDIAANLCTAGTQEAFTQFSQSQTQSTNYAADTGVANAYVCALSPPVTSVPVGMPIRVRIANANTGASTLNFGAGALPIINPDGTALGSNSVSANGVYEFIPDGAGNVQLVSASNASLSSSGIATTGDFKFRPTSETITGWIRANALTIGNVGSNATELASAGAFNLFEWHWVNFSNTQCPVYTSGGVASTRGVSAAADFAALKQIKVLDWRGVGPKGLDTMGNVAANAYSGVPFTLGSSTTPGAVCGENIHTLIIGEITAHSHGGATGGGSTGTGSTGGGGTGTGTITINKYISVALAAGGSQVLTADAGTGSQNYTVPSLSIPSLAVPALSIPALSIPSEGGSGAHNTTDLSQLVTWYIKL